MIILCLTRFETVWFSHPCVMGVTCLSIGSTYHRETPLPLRAGGWRLCIVEPKTITELTIRCVSIASGLWPRRLSRRSTSNSWRCATSVRRKLWHNSLPEKTRLKLKPGVTNPNLSLVGRNRRRLCARRVVLRPRHLPVQFLIRRLRNRTSLIEFCLGLFLPAHRSI